MKAVAIGKCDPEIRAPKALTLPFTAQCYDLGERQSPWVGDVDIERHFFEKYAAAQSCPSPSPSGYSPSTDFNSELPPSYPGYRVPPVGQLQLLIKTPKAAVKAFIVSYDLTAVPVGGRLLARERTYVSRPSSTSPNAPRAESLRFAVQLQFVCTRQDRKRQYHLSRSVKLVFAAGPGWDDGEQRVERHDEVVPPERRRRRESSPEAVRRRSLLASSPAERRRSFASSFASSPIDSPPRRRSIYAQSPEATSLGSPRQSLGQTIESWAAIRTEWEHRREVEQAEKAERERKEKEDPRPRLRRMPTRLEGFQPPPARPTSPTPPRAQPSLLSALRAASPVPPSPITMSSTRRPRRLPSRKHRAVRDSNSPRSSGARHPLCRPVGGRAQWIESSASSSARRRCNSFCIHRSVCTFVATMHVRLCVAEGRAEH